MRKFINVLSIFLMPLILFLAISIAIIFFKNDSSIIKFRFPENIKKIMIGDSHIRLSIDDNLLFNAKNIALDSEPYIFTFFKLQILLANNPSLDSVFLGSSYHNFSAYYEETAYNHQVILNYFFILPLQTRIELIKKIDNPLKFLFSVIKLQFKENTKSWLGCYADYTTEELLNKKSLQNRINGQYFLKNDLQKPFDENILYFNKIVDLCKTKNVRLFIVNTPLYPEYKKMIPGKFIKNFNYIVSYHKLKVIEFDLTNFSSKDFLPDGDHVSRSGAIKTTLQLKKMKF